MFLKEELYIGQDDLYLKNLIQSLEKNGVKITLVHSNSSHQADLARGAAVGRYGMKNHDLISIYVKKKDYDKAFEILNSID